MNGVRKLSPSPMSRLLYHVGLVLTAGPWAPAELMYSLMSELSSSASRASRLATTCVANCQSAATRVSCGQETTRISVRHAMLRDCLELTSSPILDPMKMILFRSKYPMRSVASCQHKQRKLFKANSAPRATHMAASAMWPCAATGLASRGKRST